MKLQQTTLPVNEIFGPTIQGEGIDIGRAVVFLRTHFCPVHCPGCDTAYTWNGTEKALNQDTKKVGSELMTKLNKAGKGTGLIVSGGEPLLHYKNTEFARMLLMIGLKYWIGLETSGFVGAGLSQSDQNHVIEWMGSIFHSIHWSPKITPCLHGRQIDEELLYLAPKIVKLLAHRQLNSTEYRGAVKMVVKDQIDIEVVKRLDDRFRFSEQRIPVYLMPYGIEREEILKSCEELIPALAKTGYILSPRLHSIIWGKERGR